MDENEYALFLDVKEDNILVGFFIDRSTIPIKKDLYLVRRCKSPFNDKVEVVAFLPNGVTEEVYVLLSSIENANYELVQ